jgi:hypothetical protein
MSLYIPHVFSNISVEKISHAFESLGLGQVKKVDFVSKMGNTGEYNAAYIHFEYWFDTDAARNFQDRVQNPDKEARLVYDDPWYWIVLENKSRKFVSVGGRKERLNIQHVEVVTPTKQLSNRDFADMFRAPSKPSKVKRETDNISINLDALCRNLTLDFEGRHDIEAQIEAQSDDSSEDSLFTELENQLDFEDSQLISVDVRYIKELEKENVHLRNVTRGYYEQCTGYFVECGFSQHRILLLEDELSCLKAELSLLKDCGAVNTEMYY